MSAPSGQAKITRAHRERLAIVYVRQSSLAQVREHAESTARQYALVNEAVRLGWDRDRIQVVDTDLGLSGRSATHRNGFKELVGRVCVGEVGAIFGLEVSRLARSSADLSRLLELARLTDTLVIDTDGVYDLGDFNDRLLLGLKGTMSEAELHLLAGRLQGAKLAAAERGQLRFPLPVGYVYDADGATVIDPDEEVATAVRDIFAAFRATGSAYQVVGAFAGRRFPRRAYGGVWAGELRWGRLTHARVLGILANPCYAGTYVFGRYRSRRIVDADGSVHDKITELPREQWKVVIHDHHPGFITWAEFLANQDRLAANDTRGGARPPREGIALCQGIIHCGGCGRAMSTRYRASGKADYECARARADHVATPACRSVAAATVDEAVAARLLTALGPAEVRLALAAADEVTGRQQRTTRAAELATERARYEADRAERAFLACDPDNRLVARSLEARWEAKLAALAEAETALAEAQAARAPMPPRAELEALAADLPRLWSAPTTSARDRKRLLRTLIADVTILPQPDLDKLRIGIHWRSGDTEEVLAARRLPAYQLRRTDPGALAVIRRLGPTMTNAQIAAELTTAGYVTGAGRTFDGAAVGWLRHYHKIPPPHLLEPGELTVAQVAGRLGISTGAVTAWITSGWLAARKGIGNRWCVPFPPEVEQACRQRGAASPHLHKTLDPAPAPRAADERSVAEIAALLGVKRDVVYYWVERGYLPARHGRGGRTWVRFTPELEQACRQRIASSYRLPPEVKSQAQQPAAGGAV
jgi:DNA invertase Pin-like site-specific DNA recombinase